MNNRQGSLVCVGIGMKLGAHISPIAKSHIEQADLVFCLVSDGLVELWVKEMSSQFTSLQPFYLTHECRLDCYQAMVDAMIDKVMEGLKVVGVFYGHPGVFACVPHMAITEAQQLGVLAHMEPGISADDCLYADLNIDPGTYGCCQFEASQFMFYQRKVDISAYLILWQVAIAGDTSVSRYSTGHQHRRILVEILQYHGYNLEHEVILYEAPTIAINSPRIDRISLRDLQSAELNQQTTLVIPPFEELQRNDAVLTRLNAIKNDRTIFQLIK